MKLDAARADLKVVMSGDYASVSEQARAMLNIIYSGDCAEDRVKLMRYALINWVRESDEEVDISEFHTMDIGPELFEVIQKRIGEKIKIFYLDCIYKILTEDQLVQKIFALLGSLKEEDEKVTAFSIVLQSSIVPFRQYPKDVFSGGFVDGDEVFSDIATIRLCMMTTRVMQSLDNAYKRMVAFQKILALAKNPKQKQAVLLHIVTDCRDEAVSDMREKLERLEKPLGDPRIKVVITGLPAYLEGQVHIQIEQVDEDEDGEDEEEDEDASSGAVKSAVEAKGVPN
ncbi:MAG: hypothetical protein UV05_C0062G0002 [candidate division CPR1 bacterium GW2011_GWA2_42_17]|uniref:Uncharacterized protein n=1 Tax=candidate division CPR1 bacterium GW2011_GWA2_42_17 TaxID=1618341 RepID=A0A0G1B3V9_9BACT|nr:MAG: hypothetical protein UV05_C0062G0002 [candidate division CPR1 bacterium GW2011_GWA2_42_17]